MRVPLSWLREYAPVDAAPEDIANALVRAGLEVETVERIGDDISGVVVAEVLEIEELTEFKKPIRFVRVGTPTGERWVICGATNFAVGDRVPLAPPGALLPGDFRIAAREAYGRSSDGMICSARELGIGDDHTGILVLDADAPLGADAVEVLSLRDVVFDIAVTPDRGYCFSVRGVAREAAIAFEVPFTDHGVRALPPASGGYEVHIEDVAGCRRYVARVVRGIDPAARSPLWLRRRVSMTGMRPISLAVDVTNYVMQALGQPLHAFDLDRVSGPITVRRAGPDARLTTLDDVVRELHPEDLLITDDSGPIAIAGVMGGATTEVAAVTTDLLIESAYFDPVSIGRTSRRHGLVSEASKRFERGVDPDVSPTAADLAVELLGTLAAGSSDDGATDVDHRLERESIRMAIDAPDRRAGRPYGPDVVRRRLTDVGCDVSGDDPLVVTPPSWRPDLTEPVDLTEEVIRLEGLDTLPSVLPPVPAGRGLTPVQRARRRVGRALAAAGYVEVTPYPFMGEAVLDDLGIPADDVRRRTVRLANPVAETEPVMRTTLLPGLLAVLVRNVHRSLPDVAVFEVGPVAIAGRPRAAPRLPSATRPTVEQLAELDAALPDQPEHVCLVLAGRRVPAGWWGKGRDVVWSDAVEAARVVARAVPALLTVRAGTCAPWHPGRCAELVVDGVVVGHAGEIHPRACDALGLPPRTCALELSLEPLWPHAEDIAQAPEISTFPPAAVDVALVVELSVTAADVESALRGGAGPLLEELRLFDVYTGEQVGEGRKSLAYGLRFRAPDRTFTDEEVNAMRDAAVGEAARRTGATLRT